MDNGAKRALIPIENKRNFLDVSADISKMSTRSSTAIQGPLPSRLWGRLLIPVPVDIDWSLVGHAWSFLRYDCGTFKARLGTSRLPWWSPRNGRERHGGRTRSNVWKVSPEQSGGSQRRHGSIRRSTELLLSTQEQASGAATDRIGTGRVLR